MLCKVFFAFALSATLGAYGVRVLKKRRANRSMPLVHDPIGALVESEETEPHRVVILGAPNTGKSSLCQWLLADNTVCEVFNAGADTTDFEIAKGHWFGDSNNHALEVLDTPALHYLTDASAKQWTDFADYIKTNMPKVDMIVWAFDPQSQVEDQWPKYYGQIRSTFGTDIWDRLACFAKLPQGWYVGRPGAGIVLSDMSAIRDNFLNNFITFEMDTARASGLPYEATTEATMRAQVTSIAVNGSDLAYSERWPFVPAESNLEVFPERGLYGLLQLRDDILASRTQLGVWDVGNIVPRLGPSQVNANHELKCTWPGSCRIAVTGFYLTHYDWVRVYPKGHTCGNHNEGIFPIPFKTPTSHVRADFAPEGENKTMTFQFGELGKPPSTADREYQLCYCEYGNCEEDSRFSFNVGDLTVDAVKCTVPCPTAEDRWTAPLGFCEPDSTQDSILSGDDIQFGCKPGYGIDAQVLADSYARSCVGDTVSDTAALSAAQICQRVESQPLVVFPRATFPGGVSAKYYFEDELTYSCLPGFTVDGNTNFGSATTFTMKVSESGEWVVSSNMPIEDLDAFKQHGCRRWNTSEWTACVAECGYGNRERTATCDPEGSQCAIEGRPPTTQLCEGFSKCPDCGTGANIPRAWKKQNAPELLITEGNPVAYECNYSYDYSVNGRNSRAMLTVEHTFFAKCKVNLTSSSNYIVYQDVQMNDIADPDWETNGCRRWEVSEWSACSTTCGTGIRTREVVCSTGDEADCDAAHKLQESKLTDNCFTAACPLPGPIRTTTNARRSVEASAGALVLLAAAFQGLLHLSA